MAARRPSIGFELIPRNKVPGHPPVTKPSDHPKKSQWDDVLTALELHGDKCAVRIDEPDREKRKNIKATLQTMGRKRNVFIKVRDDKTAVYAWMSEETGRYAPLEDSQRQAK